MPWTDHLKERMMLWEIEIRPRRTDAERERVIEEYKLLTHSGDGADLFMASRRGYLLEGDLDQPDAERLMSELLVDPLAEAGKVSELGGHSSENGKQTVSVLLKPGVMDPVALSVVVTLTAIQVPDCVRSRAHSALLVAPPHMDHPRSVMHGSPLGKLSHTLLACGHSSALARVNVNA